MLGKLQKLINKHQYSENTWFMEEGEFLLATYLTASVANDLNLSLIVPAWTVVLAKEEIVEVNPSKSTEVTGSREWEWFNVCSQMQCRMCLHRKGAKKPGAYSLALQPYFLLHQAPESGFPVGIWSLTESLSVHFSQWFEVICCLYSD